MESRKKALDDNAEEEEVEEPEEVDLFNNRRRHSMSVEVARRTSLGLPDNGTGLTKDYYNIDRPMSVTSLVDLIILRRTGNENKQRRRSSQLPPDLEERIKKTLAWKEMEDELNKEDVLVNFRRRMREMRKEARQAIPKESQTHRKINEERRIQLRTSLMEPYTRRRSTTESIKEAIQEFRMRQPAIIEEPQVLKSYEDDKEASDIVQRTRDLLEQLGYIKQKINLQTTADGEVSPHSQSEDQFESHLKSSSSHSENGTKKKKRKSQTISEKSLTDGGKGRSRVPSANKSRTSFKSNSSRSRYEEREDRGQVVVFPVISNLSSSRKASVPRQLTASGGRRSTDSSSPRKRTLSKTYPRDLPSPQNASSSRRSSSPYPGSSAPKRSSKSSQRSSASSTRKKSDLAQSVKPIPVRRNMEPQRRSLNNPKAIAQNV